MKPFAFLAARPSTAAAICEDEYNAVLRGSGLGRDQLVHLFLEDDPEIDLDDYAGVFVSGSQYGFGEDPATMSPEQQVTEARTLEIAREVIERDFPFMGFCYGHQALAVASGYELTNEFFEKMSIADISVTDAGRADPIFSQLPESFPVVLGHEQSFGEIPPNTEVLASSALCPVQAVRVGNNVYGTQYHPEINRAGLEVRIDYYTGSKYAVEDELQVLRASADPRDFSAGAIHIKAFVDRYRDGS